MDNFQHQFWRTKNAIVNSFRPKSDDSFGELSDSELELKLEHFRSLVSTCTRLVDICKCFNENVQNLVRSESSFGLFLKDTIAYETRDCMVANILEISSSVFENCANQRMRTKSSIERFEHDLDVFRTRAIVDCEQSIRQTERSRSTYYTALNCMKSEANKLDPDAMPSMHRFRKVQNRVRDSRVAFDRSKLISMQKIDLLVAARLNLFSQCLAAYQTDLFRFSETVFELFAQAFGRLEPYTRQFQASKIEKEPKSAMTICNKNIKSTTDIDDGSGTTSLDLIQDQQSLKYLPSMLLDDDDDETMATKTTACAVTTTTTTATTTRTFSARLAWLRSFRDFDPLQQQDNDDRKQQWQQHSNDLL